MTALNVASWRPPDDIRDFDLWDISDESRTFTTLNRSRASKTGPHHGASAGNIQEHDLEADAYNARWSAFPICDLPLEILVSIFSAVADLNGSLDQVIILQLSSVCRYWRTITLEEPKFWDFVSIKHPSWTSTVLNRSGILPLRLSLAVEDGEGMDCALLMMTHFHRVKDFLVTGVSADIDQVMANLPHESPLLETWEMRKTNHELPPPSTAFFGFRAPRLKHFTLRGFECDWASPLFKNLTKLGLHSIHNKTTPPKMLHIISMSPCLTELQLWSVFDETQGFRDWSHRCPRVDLPLLTNLFLGEHLWIPSDNMMSMLGYLTFPAKASLAIHCRVLFIDDFDRLYQSIQLVTSGTGSVHITRADLTLSGHTVRFEGKTSTESDAHVYLALQCTRRLSSLNFASRMCAILPLAHTVEELRIAGPILGQASLQAWEMLLDCFSSVKRFEVVLMPIALVRALSATDDDITGFRRKLAIFRRAPWPILHTIAIESGEHTFKDGDMLTQLIYALSKRRRAGVPIARLEIHDWVPPAESQDLMAKLREIVPEVTLGQKAQTVDRAYTR